MPWICLRRTDRSCAGRFFSAVRLGVQRLIPLVVLLALTGCAPKTPSKKPEAQPPILTIQSARLAHMDFRTITLEVVCKVANPGSETLQLSGLNARAESDGKIVAEAAKTLSQSVAPGRSAVVSITVPFEFRSLYEAGVGIGSGSSHLRFDYALVLSLSAGTTRTPLPPAVVGMQGWLPVAVPPRVSLLNMDMDTISFSEISGDLEVSVHNPNAFSLRVLGLEYALSLGGETWIEGRLSRPFDVKADGASSFRLPFRMPVISIGQGILQMLKDTHSGALSFRGILDLETDLVPGERITLPFEFTPDAQTSFEEAP